MFKRKSSTLVAGITALAKYLEFVHDAATAGTFDTKEELRGLPADWQAICCIQCRRSHMDQYLVMQQATSNG